MVDCAQCRRDISTEPFRYEAGDGRIVCEKCFYYEEAAVEPSRTEFGFLRVMMHALKIAAFIGLAGGLVLAHSIYGYNPLVSAAVAIGGIAVFLMGIIVSEIIRLGLSIRDGLTRVSINTDRFPDILRERHAGPVAPEVTQEDQEPWGGARGG